MKRALILSAFFFVFSYAAFAQVPVTISSDIDPGTIADRIAVAQNWASTIQNAITQLQTATSALQYQIEALQQLGQGSWDSFVRAWNDETVALNDYTSFLDNMPSLSQIQAVQQLVATQGFQSAKQSMDQLNNQWGYASNIVHTTDYLFQNTKQRQQEWSQILSESATQNNNDVAQLQVLNQGLGLLGSEVRDVSMNLGAWKQYFVAQAEQKKLVRLQEQQLNDQYYTGDGFANYGAPPTDLENEIDQIQGPPQ
jgi:conjugal transfer/entry exclusion protein